MKISEERLRNTRAWAAAKIETLSIAEVIVGAIEELLQMREDWKTIYDAADTLPTNEPTAKPYGWAWEWPDGQIRFVSGEACPGDKWIPLYRTADRPKVESSEARDAARYRWLRIGNWNPLDDLSGRVNRSSAYDPAEFDKQPESCGPDPDPIF